MGRVKNINAAFFTLARMPHASPRWRRRQHHGLLEYHLATWPAMGWGGILPMALAMAPDQAVFHIQRAVKDIQRAVIVGHYDDSGLVVVGDARKEFHHLAAALAVERGSWLVG